MKTILLFGILCCCKLFAQKEVQLSEITVKQNGAEYDISKFITGLDYTYLTNEYSSKSTFFYFNKKLFTGVGKIDDSYQQTSIHFKNGRIHGNWRDIIWGNSGMYHEGNFEDGLMQGAWLEGFYVFYADTTVNEIKMTPFEVEIYKKIEYENNKVIKESYYGHDWLTGIPNIAGYREIIFLDEEPSGPQTYVNEDEFRGKKIAGPKNGIETYYLSNDSINKEVLLFKNGYIISKSSYENDYLISKEEYIDNNEKYEVKVTDFYENEVIRSTGIILPEFNREKSGEWFFYKPDGVLFKKVFFKVLEEPIETYYNADGEIIK